MKRRSIAVLAAIAAATACSEPEGLFGGTERYVLIEYQGEPLPQRVPFSSSTADSLFGDTLYLGVKDARAVHIYSMTVNGVRQRIERLHGVVRHAAQNAIGIDFHCSFAVGCPAISAPSFAVVRNDTLKFVSNQWSAERVYVRR